VVASYSIERSVSLSVGVVHVGSGMMMRSKVDTGPTIDERAVDEEHEGIDRDGVLPRPKRRPSGQELGANRPSDGDVPLTPVTATHEPPPTSLVCMHSQIDPRT
jgi:hypothetical protein